MSGLYVLFKVADGEYALPASDVLHMESYAGATRVPGSPEYVAGLMQVRRRVIPVVDLRRRFGLDGAELDGDRRVLVVRQGERSVGLLVDRAREVLSIGPDHLREPPEAVAQGTERMIRSVATVGDRLLMLIDTARVIGAVERRDAGEMGRGVDGD